MGSLAGGGRVEILQAALNCSCTWDIKDRSDHLVCMQPRDKLGHCLDSLDMLCDSALEGHLSAGFFGRGRGKTHQEPVSIVEAIERDMEQTRKSPTKQQREKIKEVHRKIKEFEESNLFPGIIRLDKRGFLSSTSAVAQYMTRGKPMFSVFWNGDAFVFYQGIKYGEPGEHQPYYFISPDIQKICIVISMRCFPVRYFVNLGKDNTEKYRYSHQIYIRGSDSQDKRDLSIPKIEHLVTGEMFNAFVQQHHQQNNKYRRLGLT